MVIKTLIEQIFYNSGCVSTKIWIPFPNFLFISDEVGAVGLVMGTNSLGRILLLCGISEWPHCCVSTKFLCSGISPLLLCAHHISTSQLDSSKLASLFVNLMNIWDMAYTIYSKFSCSLDLFLHLTMYCEPIFVWETIPQKFVKWQISLRFCYCHYEAGSWNPLPRVPW